MLSIAIVVAIPAGILRAGCVGDTCKSRSVEGAATAPFCSLPEDVRQQIASGYRKGRSPEILGVASKPGLSGPVGPAWRDDSAQGHVAWPTASRAPQAGVALAMGGAGITSGEIPEGATLADVAPTIAEAVGLESPHPEVRSGSLWDGLTTGEPPRLALEIVWKGAGAEAWEADPFQEVAALGVGAEQLSPGSLPVDPAALMATLGSGALPSEHGITGTYIRADDGSLVESWTDEAPGSVVAMLADDLDERLNSSFSTLFADAPADLGLLGSDWYLSGDKDGVFLEPGATPDEQAQRVKQHFRFMRQGFGQKGMIDLVAVTLDGDTAEMEGATQALMKAAERFAPGDVLYVLASLPGATSTGGSATASSSVAGEIESAVGAPVIEGVAVGGFFLDQEVIANEGIAEDAILSAMDKVRAPGGGELFADRFSGVAVTFARYC